MLRENLVLSIALLAKGFCQIWFEQHHQTPVFHRCVVLFLWKKLLSQIRKYFIYDNVGLICSGLSGTLGSLSEVPATWRWGTLQWGPSLRRQSRAGGVTNGKRGIFPPKQSGMLSAVTGRETRRRGASRGRRCGTVIRWRAAPDRSSGPRGPRSGSFCGPDEPQVTRTAARPFLLIDFGGIQSPEKFLGCQICSGTSCFDTCIDRRNSKKEKKHPHFGWRKTPSNTFFCCKLPEGLKMPESY